MHMAVEFDSMILWPMDDFLLLCVVLDWIFYDTCEKIYCTGAPHGLLPPSRGVLS